MPPARPAPLGGPATRRFTREDVLRAGRSGGPWEFMPIAVAALRASAGDAEVRFLFSAALGRLGLRTLALEQLALVAAVGGHEPAIGQLRAALDGLASDELAASTRVENVRRNLGALGERGADLPAHVGPWAGRLDGEQAYATTDGNVVRRRTGDTEPGRWTHLADHAGAAARFVAQNLVGKATPMPPVTLEGVDPPWLMRDAARAMPRDATGFQPRLIVLQSDPMEALDGLSLADLSDVLGEQRVMLLAGADAGVRLGAWARANLEKRLTGPFVPLLGVRTRLEPGAQAEMQGALREQEARAAELKARVWERDGTRGPAYWAERLGARGERQPLRVLIPTCRYTTFLQHAGRDLARAFERMGHRAEVLIEADGQSQMSAVAYLEAMERVDPDLVVFINYTRAQLGGLLPPGQPVVCWVQDMMPHLFTSESGLGQGELDFIAGHCGEELFARYGYSRERAIACPVVASESKFHPGAISAGLRERFECEIACVTHHSETVEAMHDRLKRESASDPDAAGVLDELLPICREVAALAHDMSPWTHLKRAVCSALARRHRMAGNPDVEGAFLRNYAVPVADRAFRHLAIGWAAEIAGRRGWRLRLYGRGWEKHPTLARFSAGMTEHGEELRACYQAAAVHLHLCLTTLMHQRPMECVLSGGLPLVRPTRDALAGLNGRAKVRCVEGGQGPIGVEAQTGGAIYSFADSAEGMRYASLLTRLGMTLRYPGIVAAAGKLEDVKRRRGVEPLETDPTWLFAELEEISFADAAGLERLIERAMQRPDWREALSRSIAARVRERLTHTALAGRMIDAVGRRAAALARGKVGER